MHEYTPPTQFVVVTFNPHIHAPVADGVQIKLSQFRLRHPRQWGGCWAFCRLWEQLQLDEFWRARLENFREGTSWYHVLMVLTAYRLMDPESEARWRSC